MTLIIWQPFKRPMIVMQLVEHERARVMTTLPTLLDRLLFAVAITWSHDTLNQRKWSIESALS